MNRETVNSSLKSVLPAWISQWASSTRERLSVWLEFAQDGKRYMRAMGPSDSLVTSKLSGRNREAQLTKDYHRIEKGLALPKPKRPFGAKVEERLQLLLAEPEASELDRHSSEALKALQRWNEFGQIEDSISPHGDSPFVGLPDPNAFFGSRVSVRDYSPRQVDNALLVEAAALARSTPSVCNRQAWAVRYYTGPEATSLLQFQNGNAGFGDSIPVVALITVDSRFFSGPGERNQAWVEGGLFSMSLALAFHSLGVQTCMLNMSVKNRVADRVRTIAGVHHAELVIMLIAIGYASAGHRRASSPRRAMHEIVRKLPSV